MVTLGLFVSLKLQLRALIVKLKKVYFSIHTGDINKLNRSAFLKRFRYMQVSTRKVVLPISRRMPESLNLLYTSFERSIFTLM